MQDETGGDEDVEPAAFPGSIRRGSVLDAMEMTREERDAFLNEQGVGVLSLARGNDSYAFPVSYGYDADSELVCLMLGYAPESRKREWVDTTETATFVVHEMDDDMESRSVVVTGKLVEIDDEDDEEGCYDAFSDNAEFTVLHESGAYIEDTDLVIYRLDIEAADGRKFEHDAAGERTPQA